MSIGSTKALEIDIIEKMLVAKNDCLTMPYVPLNGVNHQIVDNEKTVNIYSLLPGLDDVQIVSKSIKGKNIVSMVSSNITASISEKSLEEFLGNINLINILLEKGEFTPIKELLILPKEIDYNFKVMKQLATEANKNKIDLLYRKYALLLKKIRELQLQNMNYQIYKEKITR